ncbi:hypothetical protein PPECC9_5180, partial [Escherichia coli PCN009]
QQKGMISLSPPTICNSAVLLNNDYWCRALSFSPTKSKNYQRYNERIKGKRQEWGILCNND